MTTYVLATEWGVSVQISAGFTPELENKVKLSVYKLVDGPNQWGGRGNVIKHPVHDGLLFDSWEEAQAYKLEHGLIKVYNHAEAMAKVGS